MKTYFSLLALAPFFVACHSKSGSHTVQADSLSTDRTTNAASGLPAPDTKASKDNFSKVIGWPAGKTPIAPEGFTVTAFATKIKSPRSIYIAPNGDIFVALSNSERDLKMKIYGEVTGKSKSEVPGKSANTVLLFRDKNNDGKFELQSQFLTGLNQPYGMLVIGDSFYVANTDGLIQYPYKTGDSKITAPGKKIVSLPAGGYNNHWTRNLIANADNTRIFISVGSGSNAGDNGMEHEVRRANILEVNPDGSGEKIYASGIRNPVGMDWAPGTHVLWAAVNERDGLGDDLVPDYITSVKEGAFYGWPYSYYGQNEDPRMKGKRPDLVKSAIAPDFPVGSHTASLGLAFYTGNKFPAKYQGGAFIGQHGSWNRSKLAGYKVAFVPFKNGKPAGKMEDFLTGFIANADKSEVYGRPVDVAVAKDGSLLIADDVSSTIWRVAHL